MGADGPCTSFWPEDSPTHEYPIHYRTCPAHLQSDDEEEELEKNVAEESLLERIYALRDIVPPSTRQSISTKLNTVSTYAWAGGSVLGKVAWVVTTSALLVGLPFALAVEDEARMAQQERDFQAQQSGANVSRPLPDFCL